MKNLTELFNEAGLSKEQIENINIGLKGQGSNGKDLELVIANNGEYVRAEKYETLKTENANLQTKLSEKENEILGLSNLKTENERLKTETEELVDNNKKTINNLKKRYEIEKKFIEDGIPKISKSYDAYHSIINYDSITIDENGNLNGIDELYNSFKNENSELFTIKNTKIVPPKNDDGKKYDDKITTKEKFSKMTVDERIKLKEDNPSLYEQLKNTK